MRNSAAFSDAVLHVVLDMDGVIVDSETVKAEAILRAFGDVPERAGDVRRWLHENFGLPRGEKIRLLAERLFGVAASTVDFEDRLRLCDEYLLAHMDGVPDIPGVAELLDQADFAFSVCSHAPLWEVERQLDRLGVLARMAFVHGHGTPKQTRLVELRAARPALPLVFVGDSPSDLAAARSAMIPFVGFGRGAAADRLRRLGAPVLSSFIPVERARTMLLQTAISPLPEESPHVSHA